jgi:hypothetical protein
MALPKNKEDLSKFLGEQILIHSPADNMVIVGGAFEEGEEVRSNQLFDTASKKVA